MSTRSRRKWHATATKRGGGWQARNSPSAFERMAGKFGGWTGVCRAHYILRMTTENDDEEPGPPPHRRHKWRYVLIAIAIVAVLLTLFNASWIAPRPPGRLILVANRGIAHPYDDRGARPGDCAATRIRPPGDN